MAQLTVSGISKSYAGKPVLVSQSLEAASGEFVALLGPSGCGKSTMLQVINGLVQADSGRVVLNGQDITGKTGSGRGMVFQGAELLPWRTVIDNVAFGLEIEGVGKAERRARAAEYLRLVGLAGYEQAWPHELSGGQQQRVGIARAFCIRPTLLMMDEPFGALDVQTRDVLQDELMRIWEAEPKTVLFVTHGIEEALYLADRIVVYSQRPARILREITVPFARPRRDEVKLDPAFLALRREIADLLRDELGETRHGKADAARGASAEGAAH
ncbi:ABC transporter ATP-binding protein [Robbsia sp. KACC 23696]|uniref:ABC transporter ATP-binding protein n=1 Tax=Robbsia sp. KACC 23696 TaxID=3149231 RepID=UPI00325BC596